VRIQENAECTGLGDPSAGSKFRLRWKISRQDPNTLYAGVRLEGPLRSRAGSTAYAGKSTGGREDDQEDGLVELPEELTDTGDPYAGERVDPRQAQFETELDDDGESSGAAASGAGARARVRICVGLSTSEFTRRIRQSYLRPQTHAFDPSLSPSLSLVRAQIYFDSSLQPRRKPVHQQGSARLQRGRPLR
jgi:hypothetical protein